MSAPDADCREYFLVEKGASPPAARSAAAAAPLPRQININSNENKPSNANQLTPYRAKKRFAVQKDVEGFARQWGEDNCGELTLTFAENITEKSEASRRFNSLRPALFALGVLSFIGCWERQMRGAWHLHLPSLWLIRCEMSLMPGSTCKSCETSSAGLPRVSTKTASW
jgi:hypothetical protein